MKKWLLYGIFVILNSCGQKFYTKKDFSFCDQKFFLDSNSLLKTNGIYVLDNIWTSQNGGQNLKIKQNKIYKFYNTGQSNFAFADTLKSDEDFAKCIKNQVTETKKKTTTLFEGYYKIQGNKIIIQNINTPLRRFNYSYGFIEFNKLIIVREAIIDGQGKFDDKYFTNYYKETYIFKPIANIEAETPPNW